MIINVALLKILVKGMAVLGPYVRTLVIVDVGTFGHFTKKFRTIVNLHLNQKHGFFLVKDAHVNASGRSRNCFFKKLKT